MDDAKLDAIRERHGRATKGPWREYQGWVHPNFDGPSPQTTNGDTAICEPLGPDAIFNRTFIAHSWQDIRDLLAEIDRLRGENRALVHDVERHIDIASSESRSYEPLAAALEWYDAHFVGRKPHPGTMPCWVTDARAIVRKPGDNDAR